MKFFPVCYIFSRVDTGSAESNLEKTFPTVNYKGEVVYYNIILLSVFCKMDVRLFPLDSHDCAIRFASYSYQGDEVGVTYLILYLLHSDDIWQDIIIKILY